MSDTMSTKFQEAWRQARILHHLPDTPEIRWAFYAGGRAVLTEVVDGFVLVVTADDLEPCLLGINDELQEFCKPPGGPH